MLAPCKDHTVSVHVADATAIFFAAVSTTGRHFFLRYDGASDELDPDADAESSCAAYPPSLWMSAP